MALHDLHRRLPRPTAATGDQSACRRRDVRMCGHHGASQGFGRRRLRRPRLRRRSPPLPEGSRTQVLTSGSRRLAEFASVMELLGVDGWDVLYTDPDTYLALDTMPRK